MRDEFTGIYEKVKWDYAVNIYHHVLNGKVVDIDSIRKFKAVPVTWNYFPRAYTFKIRLTDDFEKGLRKTLAKFYQAVHQPEDSWTNVDFKYVAKFDGKLFDGEYLVARMDRYWSNWGKWKSVNEAMRQCIKDEVEHRKAEKEKTLKKVKDGKTESHQ